MPPPPAALQPWAPLIPGHAPGLAAALDSLMCIASIDYGGYRQTLVIHGYANPARGDDFLATAQEILDVLDQAEVILTEFSFQLEFRADGGPYQALMRFEIADCP